MPWKGAIHRIIPERRSLIRDRNKLKRIFAMPARASLGRDDGGGDPLVHPANAA